jgi:hypothetical protein
MVVLTVTKESVETLYTQVRATGLVAGRKYDFHRLIMGYVGDDEFDVPRYHRILPDRKTLWPAVAHRVGWTANSDTIHFYDHDVPMRPFKYFMCETAAQGPYEYTTWGTPYPTSRGILDSQIIHFQRELDATTHRQGMVLIRSGTVAGMYVRCCVVDLGELKYTARGSELQVMGSQYPVYVSDVREARRGTIILKTGTMAQYHDLRHIVFPFHGRIQPVVFQSASNPTLLLDDMTVVPLDVSIEQISPSRPTERYVRLDFVEVDPTSAMIERPGDRDNLVNAPVANFTISDATPATGQWVTLTDTSTGQFDTWDWSIEGSEAMYWAFEGKFWTQGPHRVRWLKKGTFDVKLHVYGTIVAPGTNAGSHTRIKQVTVH